MSKPLQCFWKAVGKSVCDAKSPKSLCERNSVGGPVPLVISIMFFFFICVCSWDQAASEPYLSVERILRAIKKRIYVLGR